MKKIISPVIILILVSLFAACGGGSGEPTKAPTTVASTATRGAPSATPQAPTATSIPPTPTLVPTQTTVPNTATLMPTATMVSLQQSFGDMDSNNTDKLQVDAAFPTLPAAGKSKGTPRATLPPSQPTQVAQATQAPQPTSATQDDSPATVIYQNKFDSCDGYPEVEDERGAFGCRAGEYVLNPHVGGLRYISIPGAYSEGVYQVTGRVAQESDTPVEYGLFFGLTPDFESGYAVSVRSDGTYNVSLIAQGKFQELSPYTPSSLVRQANKIGVIHQNGNIAFFLNDELVDTFANQPVRGDGAAIFVYSNSTNYAAAFDNLGISKLNRALTFPTPKATQSNPATQPTQAKPTPPPPPPTEPPAPTPEPSQGDSNGCRLAEGEAGLLISNSYPALMTLTIGGGDWGLHEYEIPGDGELYLVTFPWGTYTYMVNIAGVGTDEGEPYEYTEGTCRQISYSP